MIVNISGHYIPDRDAWIMSLCAGKKVLHLGCTDWPLTKDRLEKRELLHQKLSSVCELLIGVDPDTDGIEELRRAMPEQVFHVSKAEDIGRIAEIAGAAWDIILAADVIEHISNLGAALDSISSLMQPSTKLIITTPSAFSIKRFFAWSLAGKEHVHPDHCYYFSPSTLTQLLRRSGLEIQSYSFFMWKNRRTINKLALCLLAPINHLTGGRLADELATICTKK